MEGSVPPGRSKKSWKNTSANDMRLVGVCEEGCKGETKMEECHKENEGVPSTAQKPAFKPTMMCEHNLKAF